MPWPKGVACGGNRSAKWLAAVRSQECLDRRRPGQLRTAHLRRVALGFPWADRYRLYRLPEDQHRYESEYRWWRKFRLSVEDVALLVDRQEGRCVCGDLLKDDWAIDHDHTTGTVRDVLHRWCNRRGMAWVDRCGLDRIVAYMKGQISGLT